jgi:hypothetical protein
MFRRYLGGGMMSFFQFTLSAFWVALMFKRAVVCGAGGLVIRSRSVKLATIIDGHANPRS